MNSDFYLYLSTFSNTLSNRLSIYSLSHLNIISSFIIYYFFNNYTSSNIFYSTPNYYNRKKGLEE